MRSNFIEQKLFPFAESPQAFAAELFFRPDGCLYSEKWRKNFRYTMITRCVFTEGVV